MRFCCLHVAFSFDNTKVQAALPHVFIGNEKVLHVFVMQQIAPQLNMNDRFWQRQSDWVDGGAHNDVLRLIKPSSGISHSDSSHHYRGTP